MASNSFLYTSDENTANELKKRGYDFVSMSNGIWMFLNNNKIIFDDLNKVIVTNKLFI